MMSKSGGDFASRLTMSEPRHMPSVPRYDLDDLSSLGSSVRNEERPNNWDFSDWQPQYESAASSKKGQKKGNPEREKEREIDLYRERSPSNGRQNGPRYHQPSTFPRTRDTPLLTAAQQRALDSIKQHLSFSDTEEIGSIDGEPNNERYMPSASHRHRQSSGSTVTNTFPSTDYASLRNHSATAENTTLRNQGAAAAPSNNSIDKYTNSFKDELVDSNQIVARLMQIRDYIKQASTMKTTLQRSQDTADLNRAEQLEQVINRLKEQENKYLDLLLHLDQQVNNGIDQSSSASATALALPLTELAGVELDGSVAGPDSDASDDVSVDLDMQSECTEEQEDLTAPAPVVYNHRTDETIIPSIRPQIEDHLGRHSDTETEAPDSARSRQSSTAGFGVLEPARTINAAAVNGRKNKLENDLTQKNDELEALQLQHDLLKKMLHQQEELRSLEARQSALLELQQDAERQLTEEKQKLSNAKDAKDAQDAARQTSTGMMALGGATGSTLASNLTLEGATASDSTDVEMVNTELLELRHRLDALKHAYDIPEQSDATVGDSEMSVQTTEEHQQLRDKLSNLKEKKSQIDNLLQELYTMRGQKQTGAKPKQSPIHNDIDASSTTSSQVHIRDSINATAAANRTANKAQDVLSVLDSNKKLKKLHDVRGRLDQLRDLVQYYQHSTEFIHGHADSDNTDEDVPPRPEADPIGGERESQSCAEPFSRKLLAHGLLTGGASSSQIDTSDLESQSSSVNLARWGHDPEIQQKVSKLKAAKLKLHRLRELVGMVQQVPDLAGTLPSELAAITASLADVEDEVNEGVGLTGAADGGVAMGGATGGGGARQGASGSAGESEQDALTRRVEREVDALRKSYYEDKWQKQQQELTEVIQERNRLLAIQKQLKDFHNQALPQMLEAAENSLGVSSGDRGLEECSVDESVTESEDTRPKVIRNPPAQQQDRRGDTQNSAGNGTAETAQVTFQEPLETVVSCDELYGRMRQQRILREELREKKKELELMMRKDRPRKQYSRNQDNQSDNVSYSNKSDAFGASLISGDVTVATWGGSTADNLESIEENHSNAGQEADQQHVSDGYPSDGIVQVEEEEEADIESDRNTYTIEDDYSRHRRPQRRQNVNVNVGGLTVDRELPPMLSPSAQALRRNREASGDLGGADNSSTNAGGSSSGAAAPFVVGQDNSRRPQAFWDPENRTLLNNARSKRHRSKQRSSSDNLDVQQSLHSLRQELESTKALVHNLQASGVAPGQFSPSVMSQQQLQQQQLIFNVNQCYSQLMYQQHELTELRRRIEQVPESPQSHPSPSMNYNSLLSTGGVPPPGGLPGTRPAVQPPFWTALDDNGIPMVPSGLGSAGSVIVNDLENNGGQGGASRNVYDGSRYMYDRNTARESRRDSDNVAIHTIQADDNESRMHEISAVPKLNLQQVDNRLNRRENLHVQTSNDSVVARSNKTPTRAKAASRLASLQRRTQPFTASDPEFRANQLGYMARESGYRPGLSADISGSAGLVNDTASVSSAVSSVPGGDAMRNDPRDSVDASGVPGSTDSLFEALRETIYAEVATLISQNENRPHFLIELFRELQMLVSDYLRQRALYAIQDLVTRHLTDDDLSRVRAAKREVYQGWSTDLQYNKEQQTPSESLVTSDDEHVRARTHATNLRMQPANKHRSSNGQTVTRHTAQMNTTAHSGAMRHGPVVTSVVPASGVEVQQVFDYTEPADDTSSMSTPNSNSYWDHPFLKDSLGDTVIHLDQAMKRMREYEGRLSELEKERAANKSASSNKQAESTTSEAASSSAQDKGNDSDTSDVPYPRIDTAQLDSQIKTIMAEVLPVLSEHVDDVCNPALLSYIQRLLLALTRQPQQTHEFVRFFHKQLGSILHDSLAKFEGKKMRECREDLVVDLAEILFNELAFFRLMQDLEPNSMMKTKSVQWRQGSQTSTETDVQQSHASQMSEITNESDTDTDNDLDVGEDTTTAAESDVTSSAQLSEEDEDESLVSDEDDQLTAEAEAEERQQEAGKSHMESDERNTQQNGGKTERLTQEEDRSEQENLGKDRDDELASCVQITNDLHAAGFKFELAVSETKPFTRIGSDEDDCDDTSILSGAEDLSESAVARDACKEAAAAMATTESTNDTEECEDLTNQISRCQNEATNGSTSTDSEENAEQVSLDDVASPSTVIEAGDNNGNVEKSEQKVNGHTEESDELTVDDLPSKLSGFEQFSVNDQDISVAMSNESASNDVLAAVINETSDGAELAGDPQAIQEPAALSTDGVRTV